AVVQAKDNSYYLRKNLDKKYNIGGSIFMDYKNKLDGTDKNIVIYGHNMKNDSMFGTLKNILKEEWYNNEENYIINLTTEKEEKKYKVFSVYKIKTEDYYIDTEFKENEFEKFINTLKDRSIKDFGTEIDEQDNILTLSTCADNNAYRIVLHAKQID
ncbi:MAG: class B sortase, partial [Clostridia bacterium]|nr:class B sortase [Clostridia bacterium]